MENQFLHFVLLPHLAQGHLLPMVDMGKQLAKHGVTVTIIMTSLNAAKFESTINRAIKTGSKISLLHVKFPYVEAGLPEGFENMDSLPSRDMFQNLYHGMCLMKNPIEKLIEDFSAPPSCIISDKHLAWTQDTACKFNIPRIVFDGTSCFSLLCTHVIIKSKVYETVSDDSEPFVVPGLPDTILLTKSQLSGAINIGGPSYLRDVRNEIRRTELLAFGEVVNTFEELEPAYVKEYKKARGNKLWCIGPVSLSNKEKQDMVERGNKSNTDENKCLEWLEEQETRSVVYACLGSLSRISQVQMIELGLGLESSNKPFIWVIKQGDEAKEFEKWVEKDGFEERIKGRGFLIKGWAPQVLILSHSSIGCFLTHCGWNSTLEGVSAGLPLITWPMFAEQFYNENLVVQVLKVGVRIGAKLALKWWEEEKFCVLIKREEVKNAVDQVMDEGEEGRERRKRAREFGFLANLALQEGGSSYVNMKLLIQDIREHHYNKSKDTRNN